jgi:hypothetical protein
MQYGRHCFADNSIGKYGKRPDSECKMPCTQDKSRRCGGGWRNSVVELPPTPKSYKSMIGETDEGCFKDSGKRDLPTLIREANSEPVKCIQMAKDKGFKYAGL